MTLRLNGSTSGYSEIDAPAIAGDQLFTLPTTGGTIVTTSGTQTLSNKTVQGGSIVTGTLTATTSGSAIDYGNIPSWVKQITVLIDGMSVTGADSVLIQLGDSGGIETTGYTFHGAYLTDASQTSTIATNGFYVTIGNGSTFIYGAVNLYLMGNNIWICSYSLGGVLTTANYAFMGGGRKALSDTLDRLRITVTGTNTFDLGAVNILYQG